jgi:TonB-linked SusC/RagA family outer membrane protein
MKRYILFGLSLLMAFPLSVAAQDEDVDEEVEAPVRKAVPKKKQYETRTVKGRVVDASTNQPLSGAIVQAVEFEGYSVLTEDDGTYELKLPIFATSVYVSSPDYNAVRIGLSRDEQQVDARLHTATFDADYSKDMNVRSDYTASDFKYTNALNIKDEIQKQLGAFAYTQNHNATPGVGGVIFLRGLNSLNVNAQPLVVIDDVIIDQQYGRPVVHEGLYNDILSNVNPADIESVTVLRNGTALYGAKGGNGVILIKTKRSHSMATRITASASAGITLEPKYLSMMNASQYRTYASDLLKTTGTRLSDFQFLNENPSYYYYNLYHNDTDWKDLVYRTAVTQNYGINVEGGDAVANYNLSVGYTMAQSSLKENDLSRLNIRFNTDISVTSRLDLKFDASFSNQTRSLRDDGAPSGYDERTPTSPSFLAYAKSPFLNAYSFGRGLFSDSKWEIADEAYLDQALSNYPQYNWRLGNPAALNEYAEGENKNRFENSMLNIAVTPKFTFNPHLALQEHFSYNLVNTNEKYYLPVNGMPAYYVASVGAKRENEVRSLFSRQSSIMSDTRLMWNNRYNAHSIGVFGGVRIMWESFKLNNQMGYNTGSDKTPFMSSSLLNASTVGNTDNWNSITWYAQADYNYLGRYYLQANLTMDGSSRFGPDAGLKLLKAGWGIFPGVQASWVVTNEPWMAGVKGINYLRLTAGFDVSGNDDIDYNAARSYFRARQFLQGGDRASGLSFDGIGNDEIQWETTRRFNVGMEAHFIDNRLALNLNYFRSTTDNLLTYQALGYLSGLEQNWSNGGKLQNEGFDVSFTAKVLALKDWQWQLGASVGHYKNKITELADGAQELMTTAYGATILTRVGQAANLFYGYRTNGVYATAADAAREGLYILGSNGITQTPFQAGDMRFVDLYDDARYPGRIDENDRTVIGDPNPDIYGNIFTSLTWKRLKLDVRFNYSLGNDVYNYMRAQLEGGSRFMNQTTNLLQRWQIEGQQTDVPRISFQDEMGNSRFSDRWIEDGSYLRLKTVTLSYNLPLNSQFIQGLQFWIQANNVFTLTRYLGSDPEFASTGSVLGQGIDLGQLPQSRSIVAGVKINL